MERITYEEIINKLSPHVWVYKNKKAYVATKKSFEKHSNIEFISENITGFIKDLKKDKGEVIIN
jgi:dihydrofolate reductase